MTSPGVGPERSERSDRPERPALPFQYVVLRCVPQVAREEFVNVAVVLHCELVDFLAVASAVDRQRLRALDAGLDVDAVVRALAAVEAICADDPGAWPSRGDKPGVRFRWIASPRSTVVQPSPIHGGLTADPTRELARLLDTLVR